MDAKKLLHTLTLRTVVNGAPSKFRGARKAEVKMGYREAREVARIRQELRERLMSERHEGTGEILARLRSLADSESSELKSEYERWKLRFELLASSSRNN